MWVPHRLGGGAREPRLLESYEADEILMLLSAKMDNDIWDRAVHAGDMFSDVQDVQVPAKAKLLLGKLLAGGGRNKF